MKPRTTLILVGVFLALLAYVYFGEVRRPASPAPTTPTQAPVLSIKADQVVELIVKGDGQETRLARPVGGEWRLEAPTPDAADLERVGQALDRLVTLTASRTLTETGSLEDYGLTQPSLEVTLRLDGGQSQVLRIGAKNPQQTSWYAQVPGQSAVHLVPDWVVQSLRELVDRPPVRPTPTPTPTVTDTPLASPTPAVTSTPQPSATPGS